MSRLACLSVPLFPLAARLRSEPELRHEALAVAVGQGDTARVTAATRLACVRTRCHHGVPLGIGERCGLAGGAQGHQARHAVAEQPSCEAVQRIEIHRPARAERGHDRYPESLEHPSTIAPPGRNEQF